MSQYSAGQLATAAVACIVLGALLIFFVVDWLGGLLVIAGAIIGFVVLVRFINEMD